MESAPKSMTPYRESLKERIITSAMHSFAQKGIKAVKMDVIAAELSVSKRTLYELYNDKENLLFEGVRRYHSQKQEEIDEVTRQGDNVMSIILDLYLMKLKELSVTSPLFYRDLTKYPQIMAYMRKDNEKNHDRFLEFMQRGVNEGYFRSEVNYDLIGHLFDAVGSFMMEHLFEKYRFEELFVNMIFVPLRGFCTSKGVKVLDQFLTQHSKANTNKDE